MEYGQVNYPTNISKVNNIKFNILLIILDKFFSLERISQYLNDLYAKVRAKGEERIKNTSTLIYNLNKKLASYSELHGVKVDYSKNVEDNFNIFSYKKVKFYTGVVIIFFNNLLIIF